MKHTIGSAAVALLLTTATPSFASAAGGNLLDQWKDEAGVKGYADPYIGNDTPGACLPDVKAKLDKAEFAAIAAEIARKEAQISPAEMISEKVDDCLSQLLEKKPSLYFSGSFLGTTLEQVLDGLCRQVHAHTFAALNQFERNINSRIPGVYVPGSGTIRPGLNIDGTDEQREATEKKIEETERRIEEMIRSVPVEPLFNPSERQPANPSATVPDSWWDRIVGGGSGGKSGPTPGLSR